MANTSNDVYRKQAQPAAMRSSLEKALIQLDALAVENAIAELPNGPLAVALGALANDFQYDRMLELIRQADEIESL